MLFGPPDHLDIRILIPVTFGCKDTLKNPVCRGHLVILAELKELMTCECLCMWEVSQSTSYDTQLNKMSIDCRYRFYIFKKAILNSISCVDKIPSTQNWLRRYGCHMNFWYVQIKCVYMCFVSFPHIYSFTALAICIFCKFLSVFFE